MFLYSLILDREMEWDGLKDPNRNPGKGSPCLFVSHDLIKESARLPRHRIGQRFIRILLSTGTDLSILTNDDLALNDLPNEYQYPSYASAAGATTTNCNNSVDSTEISSPTVSNYKDWQTEKQELESQIRKQASQIEHIQAELQAKENRSKDLEERLADALELAHTRDLRHVEMMEKFEILMRSHNQLEPRPVSATAYASKVSDYESSLENNQFTPPCRNLSHTLPPSKKQTPTPHLKILFTIYSSKRRNDTLNTGWDSHRAEFPTIQCWRNQWIPTTSHSSPLPRLNREKR